MADGILPEAFELDGLRLIPWHTDCPRARRRTTRRVGRSASVPRWSIHLRSYGATKACAMYKSARCGHGVDCFCDGGIQKADKETGVRHADATMVEASVTLS